MKNLTTTIKTVAIHRVGDSPIFGESVIDVSLEDAAAGCYIVVKSFSDDVSQGEIKLDLDEILKIAEVASQLMDQAGVKDEDTGS